MNSGTMAFTSCTTDDTTFTATFEMESLEYGINIIDHAAEPMQQSIVVVRQLVGALQKMQNAFYASMESK